MPGALCALRFGVRTWMLRSQANTFWIHVITRKLEAIRHKIPLDPAPPCLVSLTTTQTPILHTIRPLDESSSAEDGSFGRIL